LTSPPGSSASPLTRSRSRMASSMRRRPQGRYGELAAERTSSARQPPRCRRSRPHSTRLSASPCRASTSRPR
jgi:hypothetical protein